MTFTIGTSTILWPIVLRLFLPNCDWWEIMFVFRKDRYLGIRNDSRSLRDSVLSCLVRFCVCQKYILDERTKPKKSWHSSTNYLCVKNLKTLAGDRCPTWICASPVQFDARKLTNRLFSLTSCLLLSVFPLHPHTCDPLATQYPLRGLSDYAKVLRSTYTLNSWIW